MANSRDFHVTLSDGLNASCYCPRCETVAFRDRFARLSGVTATGRERLRQCVSLLSAGCSLAGLPVAEGLPCPDWAWRLLSGRVCPHNLRLCGYKLSREGTWLKIDG